MRTWPDRGVILVVAVSVTLLHSLGAASDDSQRQAVFVHPAEFLVTGPDGAILQQTIVGDKLVISPAEVGTGTDSSRVFYFDLPQAPKGASLKSPRPASAGETAASVPQYRRSILGQAAIYWKLRPSTGSTRILQNLDSEGGTSQCPRA